MKRLLIAATLALGALAGSEMQAQANGGGKATFGIGLNLTFSVGYSCANACPPTYGCGTPIPYPSCQSCQGGYPMAGYGGFDPSTMGMAPQGYGMAPQGYPMPQYAGGYNNYGGGSGTPSAQPAPAAPSQPTSTTSGYGNYPIFTGGQGVYAVAE